MIEMGVRPNAGLDRKETIIKLDNQIKAEPKKPSMGVDVVKLTSSLNAGDLYPKAFNDFRKRGFLCDVVFGFLEKGTQTCAHRIVLSCHSQFFRERLADSKNMYTREKPFTIDKATPYIFEFVLEFIYNGTVDVPRNAVFALCKVAHEYQVGELRTLCIQSFSETFNLQSCLQLPQNQQPIQLPAPNSLKTAASQPQPQEEAPQQLSLLVLAQQASLEKSKYGHDENKAANNLVKKVPTRVEGIKTCCVETCKALARHSSKYCINHGSKICSFENCTTGARGGSKFCVTHGGGRRCAVHNCNTSARGRSKLCILHGGGKRCIIKFCNKSARGGSQKCISHGGGRLCDVASCSKPRCIPAKFCEFHTKVKAEKGNDKAWKPQGVKRSRYGNQDAYKSKSLEASLPKKIGRPKRQRCSVERAVLATKNE